jgi:PIN like domain
VPRDALVFFTDRDLGTRFPEIVAAGGLEVKRHRDHFPPDCPDEIWLETVGKEKWIAVTRNARIRYKPNELAAVTRHRVRLLVVIGKVPFPQLAKHFVATAPRIIDFVEHHQAPLDCEGLSAAPLGAGEKCKCDWKRCDLVSEAFPKSFLHRIGDLGGLQAIRRC